MARLRRRQCQNRFKYGLQIGDKTIGTGQQPYIRRSFLIMAAGIQRQFQPLDTRRRARTAQHQHFQQADILPTLSRVAAKGGQRMLEHTEQITRPEPVGDQHRRQPQPDADRGIGQRLSGTVIDGDAITPEHGGDPVGDIAVGRDQHSGIGRGIGLQHFAHGKGRDHCLMLRPAAGYRRDLIHHRRIGIHARINAGQHINQHLTMMRCLGIQRAIGPRCGPIFRRRAQLIDQLQQLILGMALGQGFTDNAAIKTRQQHCAARQVEYGSHQGGCRRDRPGGPGNDDRIGRSLAGHEIRRPAQPPVAILAGIGRPAFGQNTRPMLAENVEELEHFLPVMGVIIRNQPGQRLKRNALDVELVKQAGKFGGEINRPLRRRLFIRRGRRHNRPRQAQLPLKTTDRRCQRFQPRIVAGQDQLILIHIANRAQDRQQD